MDNNEFYIFDKNHFNTMQLKDRILLYNNTDCQVIWANESGKSILDKLDGNKSISGIICEISEEYDLPENVVETYVNDFIEHLILNKMVVLKREYKRNTDRCIRGINRLYLEVAKGRLERSIKDTRKILDKVAAASQEKEIMLFLNCEELDSKKIYDILSVTMEYNRFLVYTRIKPNKLSLDLLRLCCNNKKIKFIIPLVHSDEFQNDKLTYPGYYRNFLECIKDCISNSITCYLGLKITGENVKVLNDMQQQAFDLGMAGIFLDDYDIDDEACLVELYQNNTFLNSWKNNRIKKRSNYFSIIMYRGFCQNSISNLQKKKHCGIGLEELYIDINNRVFPCHRLQETEYYYHSLDEYLKSREKDYSDQIISDKCRNCFAWCICLGGCRAKNILEGSHINAIATDCAIKKKNIKKIFFDE